MRNCDTFPTQPPRNPDTAPLRGAISGLREGCVGKVSKSVSLALCRGIPKMMMHDVHLCPYISLVRAPYWLQASVCVRERETGVRSYKL